MKVVLFAGAGVSAELGVPAMRAMADGFVVHLRTNGYTKEFVDALAQQLAGEGYDMEQVIDDLDSFARGSAATARWGLPTVPGLAPLESLRAEAEWYVAHLCERVDEAASRALWGPILEKSRDSELTLATTNYDRAVELAALGHGIAVNDGFPEFDSGGLVSWRGVRHGAGVPLLKLHGSTDWYHDSSTRTVWKLRHAMPVFGSITVSSAESDVSLGSALVLPSREKKVTSPPYPELASEFRQAIGDADLVIFVGSSLRDPDLFDLARYSGEAKPTIVVNRSDRSALPGTGVIMSASRFLISVAPAIVTASDPQAAVGMAQAASGFSTPILEPYMAAIDSQRSSEQRCSAIDALAAARVSLDRSAIESMLVADDVMVQTFALGLVPDAAEATALATKADELAATRPGTRFAQEAALLSTVMKNERTG